VVEVMEEVWISCRQILASPISFKVCSPIQFVAILFFHADLAKTILLTAEICILLSFDLFMHNH